MRCDSSVPMPAIGSSSSSSRGCVASAIAISSWRCSPWARLAASTSARSPRPTSLEDRARRVAQRARRARAGRQKRKLWPACACTASATLSSAREVAVDAGDLERAREARAASAPARASAVMSSPAKRIVPASGRRSPASWPMSVVLPAPFGPMIACVSPWRTSSVDPVGRAQRAERLAQAVDVEQRVTHRGRLPAAGRRARAARTAPPARGSGRG